MSYSIRILGYAFVLFFFSNFVSAQEATIQGFVFAENNTPLENALIKLNNKTTVTLSNGYYSIKAPANQIFSISISHIGYKPIVTQSVKLSENEIFVFNPVLKINITQIGEIIVSASGTKKTLGITAIAPELVKNIPGATAGIGTILKLLPGVNSNNELSSQYHVRGGNYDENLIYINGIEVYRPFLIRSAQQEGLSVVNSSMVQNIAFSAGGFSAKYGDRLSSMLDIAYKEPTTSSVEATASLLGGGITLATASKDTKFSAITGIRYRNNNLFITSQQIQSNTNPIFADAQTYLTYRLHPKWQINVLGQLSKNVYKNRPTKRQTNFGTITNPKTLTVFYEGEEENNYSTSMGAIKIAHQVNATTSLYAQASIYDTSETEFSDVTAQYELSLQNGEPQQPDEERNLGTQLTLADNKLKAIITALNIGGTITKNKSEWSWGLHYKKEQFKDVLKESEFIDSANTILTPVNPNLSTNIPEEIFGELIVPFTAINTSNDAQNQRISGFLQHHNSVALNEHLLTYTLGVRAHQWTTTILESKKTQRFISPRVQLQFIPNWDKNMRFNMAIGNYQQPPFYRELRAQNGQLNGNIKAQNSTHFVFGNEYSFRLFNRNFKLLSEAYYKSIRQLNSYTIEDVRIRYAATNTAKAYAYGADFRLHGAFVPGTDSWVSLGYLKTEENQNNRGYIARPTDQRLKFGLLFQDYVPTIPNLKMYLNLVYNTGVPGGSPTFTDPYIYQTRLPDYKRADLGISHIFVDENKRINTNGWLRHCKELSVGIELFNLFNNQNSITNTWVRDVESKNEFAVPNFMTGRVLNIKLNVQF